MILSYTVEMKTGSRKTFTATKKVQSETGARLQRTALRRNNKNVEYSNFRLETDKRKLIKFL